MKKTIILIFVFSSLLFGCKKVFFEPEPGNNKEAIFENLHKTFVESYGPTNERHIDWNALYATYRPQVNNSMSDDQLFSVLSSMLSHLNDGHVNLVAPGKPQFNSNYILNNDIGDLLFNEDVIKNNYLGTDIKSDDGYFYGRIKNENIGYIYFEYVADNFFILDEFLDANASAEGIIIDMRHNSGGDFTFSFSTMGRLSPDNHLVFRSRTKNGPGTNDFTDWYDWNISSEGDYFNKPVVVLTDRYTISAAERTVMALQSFPNVTTLGDTTCGAHATMIGRELANGWYYTIPTQNTLLYDGNSYEGIGLAPDLYFKNIQSDVNMGIDKTLQEAIDRF